MKGLRHQHLWIPSTTVNAARVIAARRNAGKEHLTRRKHAKWADTTLDFIGVMGEISVSHYLQLPMDCTQRMAGDGGIDLTTTHGTHICVKANHRGTNPYGIVERRADVPDDYLVIFTYGNCQKDSCECEQDHGRMWHIAGWLEGWEFWRDCEKKDWGWGPRYVVPLMGKACPLYPMDAMY